MIPILIIVALALGLFLGYKAGAYHTNKVNNTLRSQIEILENQVSLLQGYSNYWGKETAGSFTLLNTISQHHTSSSASTINTVIQLLSSMQREQGTSMTSESQQKIQELINQAKAITSP